MFVGENGDGFDIPDSASLHEGIIVQAEDNSSQTNNNNHNNNLPNDHCFAMEEHGADYSDQNLAANHQDMGAAWIDLDVQNHHLNQQEMEQCYNNMVDHHSNDGNNTHEIIQDYATYDPNFLQEMVTFSSSNNGATHDLLNVLPMPRCSSSSLLPINPPPPSVSFANTAQKSPSFLASLGLLGELNNPSMDGSSSSIVYDPLLPLNLQPQPPFLRELFHSLPYGGYGNLGGGSNNVNGGVSSLFGGGIDEREHVDYQNGSVGQFDNGVFEFTAGELDSIGKNRDGKVAKHFATERHRRVLLNDKYEALKNLCPNSTKNDRASIVAHAIDYINELKRTVNELTVLAEQKRCIRERLKRPKAESEGVELGNASKSTGEMEAPFNNGSSTLRSSWLHRKSKNTEVDVRIIDDEVTVKLVQQKKINCLLFVSKVLDDLQLDLHHVAGGLIGDYYSYLFNSKICEGSIVYASAVANKLIEVVDTQYAAAIPPSNNCSY